MRRWVFWFACVLVLGSSSASFGQEPSGPRTLENLLKSDDSEKSGASAAADGADAGPKRPEGTVSRPKDGVQHPDLDKAWEVYEAAVGEAAEEIRAAVAKQFDKAAADGLLPIVKKWKALGEAFDEQGTLPAEKETEKVVKAAAGAFARASEDLRLAYEQTIKAVTKQAVNDKAMVEKAEKVEAELKSLDLTLERQAAATRKEVAVFLADLGERNAFVGSGEFGKGTDLGYEGLKIEVAGQPVKKGLSMHPPSNGASTVTYNVPNGFTRFQARAAINDSAANHAEKTPVIFQISSGTRILWQSQAIRGAGRGEDCVCDLKGAKTVTLSVVCRGSNDSAHAVWVDPRLIRK